VAAYHLLSILCAPLKIKDQLIGVIYVDNRIHSGMFQQSDFELISAFANQAAVAINNAQLFDDLQESNEELEIAYQATLEGWVRALDFSADGRLLVAAAGDRRLWLWDTASGNVVAQFVGHTDVVTDCALSADGRTLVSSSLDGTLKVWDVGARTLRHTLAREWANNAQGWLVTVNDQGHWSAVQGCAISADGRLAASASSDQTVILWDVASGQALQVLSGHGGAVNACAFSPDAQQLVSGSSDRTLRIWNCASGESRALAAHRRVRTSPWRAGGERGGAARADQPQGVAVAHRRHGRRRDLR
jgi:WD40 repeat protein